MKLSMEEIFGKNVKYYRYVNNYTQEKLAELTDFNVGYISQIELGNHNISFTKIIDLAAVLNVEPYKLFLKETATAKLPLRVNLYKNK